MKDSKYITGYILCVRVCVGNSDPERGGSSEGSEEKVLSETGDPPDSPRDSGCYESSETLENGNNSLPLL